VIFFGAGPYKTVSEFMGALRIKIGRDNGLVDTDATTKARGRQ